MPTYAYPTRSKTLDTATVATLEDQLNEVDIPQGYRNALLTQLLFRKESPGLTMQGNDLRLPQTAMQRKTMGGTRAEAFVNFESGVTATEFSGLEQLNTSIADGPTVTYTDYSYYSAFVAISGIQKIENTGRMKRLDILRASQNQEIRGLIRRMEGHLHGTNTDSVKGSQKQFAGIRHKIKLDPTTSTVVQGLNQSTFTPWRNQYTTSVGSFAAGGLDAMRAMYFSIAGVNNYEPADLIFNNSTIAGYLVKALEGIHRIVGSLKGSDLSSSKLPTFMDIPIIHTDDAASQTQIWMTTSYFQNIIHEGADWSETIPGEPNDQWVKDQKRYVFGAAPLMCLRREKQGIMGGITA